MESDDSIIMNQNDADKWKADVLSHILFALAASSELKAVLVYKGALILNKRLATERMSLDIDSNLLQAFVSACPGMKDQAILLEKIFTTAISKYFNRQDPVRYELSSIKIERTPPVDHPLGWDAFKIKINIADFKNRGVRGLQALTIDVAAPETLTINSVSEIDLGGNVVNAYTLERIAGEKMRAFLSTLPAYRAKVKKPGEAVRVKDLYDLARIIRAKPITDESFWEMAGEEFKLACSSRYIDCAGLLTFKENWVETQRLYETDPMLPKDVQFDEIDKIITDINQFLSKRKITPFKSTLPEK
jgi:hypothetical protein